MATLREKRPGVWEVRVFVVAGADGRPTQLSKTIHGGKREAQRVAAEMEVGPGRSASAGRSVGGVLDAWVEQASDTLRALSEALEERLLELGSTRGTRPTGDDEFVSGPPGSATRAGDPR